MPLTLADLPEDIWRLIFTDLACARDLRAVALQCRRLNQIVQEEGWRVFVKTRFRSLDIPVPSSKRNVTWQQLADSLTWQSRNWDRRAVRFEYIRPVEETRHSGRPYQPIVDADYDFEEQQETLIWGAGENIVARFRKKRPLGQASNVSWRYSAGTKVGYKCGRGDVRALSIVKDWRAHNGDRAFLAGRDNGDLGLCSLEPPRFGKLIAAFKGEPKAEGSPGGAITNPWSSHSTINSVDILNTGSKMLAAAATRTRVLIYDMPEDEPTDLYPSDYFKLGEDTVGSPEISSDHLTQICHATWMGQNKTIAIALKGCQDPLRYLTLTPTGWVVQTAAKNSKLENDFGIRYGNVCPKSLSPIRPQGLNQTSTDLLLSAWRDGTCRLQDLRTPSSFDMVYQDDVDPAATMEVLMSWGTERFIGGGMDAGLIKVFDFRWHRPYHHTEALPCADRVPYPPPCQPFLKDPLHVALRAYNVGAVCDHVSKKPCRYHGLARHSYYRPNSCFLMSRAMYETQISTSARRIISDGAIWSFAKISDCMPNFYVGVSGGIIECALNPYTAKPLIDPNFGFQDWRSYQPEVEGYVSSPIKVKLMETGDGRMGGRLNGTYTMPPLWCTKHEILTPEDLPRGQNWTPLDSKLAKFAKEDMARPPDPRCRLDEQFECNDRQWRRLRKFAASTSTPTQRV